MSQTLRDIDFDKHGLVHTCVKLPLSFDAERLLAEIRSIPGELWGERRDPMIHGNVDAVFVKGYAPIEREPDEERPILAQLPYFRSLIYTLIPGTPAKCVVASLKPNARVLMHRDGHEVEDPLHLYFRDTLRVHLPVTTNSKVTFFCNGEFFHMPTGEVWAVNNLADHAVINDDPISERTHVILDVHPIQETVKLVNRGDRTLGRKDREALARIMTDSCSPSESPYARGKPLPLD